MFDGEVETDYGEDPVERLKGQLSLGCLPDESLVAELKTCVRNGDWDVCPWLAVCYGFGWGVPQDKFVSDVLLSLATAKESSEVLAANEYVATLAGCIKNGNRSSWSNDEVRLQHGGKLLSEILTNYTVVDIETTGFSPYKSDITELAAVRVREGEIVDCFQELVHTDRIIPECVARKTGITNDLVVNARPIKDVLSEFLAFLGNDVLVGYNIEKFDIPFICYNAETVLECSVCNDIVDVLPMVKAACPGLRSYKLDDIRCCFGLNCNGSHRALKDCKDTYYLYAKLDKISEEVSDGEPVENEFKGFDIPSDFEPVLKPQIPTHYKERWNYVASHPFKTFASSILSITGDSVKVPRVAAEEVVVRLGATLKSSTTRDCDFCVVLCDEGTGKKAAAEKWKAQGSPLRMIGPDEFLEMVRASLAEKPLTAKEMPIEVSEEIDIEVS